MTIRFRDEPDESLPDYQRNPHLDRESMFTEKRCRVGSSGTSLSGLCASLMVAAGRNTDVLAEQTSSVATGGSADRLAASRP